MLLAASSLSIEALTGIVAAVAGAVLSAIFVDIYVKIKATSKKAKERKRHEEEEEFREIITESLDKSLQPIETEISNVAKEVETVKNDVQTIKNKDIDLLKTANCDSLRNQLLAVYRHCKKQGYRTEQDVENFEYMYRSYKALGGNSFIVTIHNEFNEIDVHVD